MNSKTNTVRAILLDASECDRPETDNPDTIEISATDLQLILERHITEPPQCLHQIAEPAEDIWPCINIDVDEHGAITNAKLYSPGLPAGNHDVYPVRVPYMDEHTEAWLTCVKELERFDSSFLNREGMNGLECAASVIRELVSRAQRAAAPQAVQPAVPDGWKLVPMEPQDMQQVAGAQAIRFDTTVINKMWTANKVYREMVAAAPAHPAEGVPAQERLERLRVNPADEETPKYVYGDKYALLDVIALSTALEAAKKQLAATQPAAQGLDAKESDYQRGYRHGYNRRDAEVKGALL